MPLYNNLIKQPTQKRYTYVEVCSNEMIKYANIIIRYIKLFSPYNSHNGFRNLFIEKRVKIMLKGVGQWQK